MTFFFYFVYVIFFFVFFFFFFSSRRRHTRCLSDWSSDVCSSDLALLGLEHRADPRRETQALESRRRKHDGLALASIELREARVDVAAKRLHLDRKSVV